jgi:alkylation response protein AidB-like acyl-CoA dehydrogenase
MVKMLDHHGGFADVYTVFAKIDGDKFSTFIIERGFEGFTQGSGGT